MRLHPAAHVVDLFAEDTEAIVLRLAIDIEAWVISRDVRKIGRGT